MPYRVSRLVKVYRVQRNTILQDLTLFFRKASLFYGMTPTGARGNFWDTTLGLTRMALRLLECSIISEKEGLQIAQNTIFNNAALDPASPEQGRFANRMNRDY